jgi:hypothetical protein
LDCERSLDLVAWCGGFNHGKRRIQSDLISEIPLHGSRAAACNWANEELTNAVDVVPSALLRLSHHALVSPSGG